MKGKYEREYKSIISSPCGCSGSQVEVSIGDWRKRMKDLARIADALVAINRSAHRSKKAGISKCKFEVKNDCIRYLVKNELMKPVAKQKVNNRDCIVLQIGDYSCHCPVDKYPYQDAIPDNLPTLDPLAKEKWDKPPMSYQAAVRVFKDLGLKIEHIKLIRCPHCNQGWRYDLVEGNYCRRDWARATTRTCPDCFVPRRWYDDDDECPDCFLPDWKCCCDDED